MDDIGRERFRALYLLRVLADENPEHEEILGEAHKLLTGWIEVNYYPDVAGLPLTAAEISSCQLAKWFTLPPHELKKLKRAASSDIEFHGPDDPTKDASDG